MMILAMRSYIVCMQHYPDTSALYDIEKYFPVLKPCLRISDHVSLCRGKTGTGQDCACDTVVSFEIVSTGSTLVHTSMP